ncbi:unnamed protein product [Leuciscus chuanchicus]
MSANVTEQLEKDLGSCKWFSIQCDESVDSSSTAQLMVFIRMVFSDLSVKEEFLTLLPLKTTTRGVDIYAAVKKYFMEKNVPFEKLVSVTTDGAPAMTGQHAGFVALCRGDPDFPKFLHYHCIIHQQALCAKVMGFDHVMTPVIKIINSIRSKAKQHRGEDTSMLQDTEWLLDLAFLTDITVKLNNLNCELQGKEEEIASLSIHAVDAK